MKSIKFRRPYYKANGEFSHFSFFEITPDHNVHVTNLPKSLGVPRADELSTGFQDESGKEMYMGDIVNYGKYTDNQTDCNWEIVWEGCGFESKEIRTLGGKNSSFPLDNESGKIIGNIHENKNILTA